MAATKNHDYHILPPDQWPLIGAFSALALFGGGVMWMHDNPYGKFVFLLGLLGVLVTMFSWWGNVIREGHEGDHTPVVQLHLRYGMILFIASEVMFFVAWFWAFFSSALFPAPVELVDGAVQHHHRCDDRGAWPMKGIEVLDPFGFPLLNTFILLCSGTTVTWAHHALIHGDREGLKKGLWCTILLGLLFTSIQAYEYTHAPFAFKGNIYRRDLLHGDRLPRLPRHHRHHLPDRLPGPRLQGRLHAQASFRLRSGGLVLAFRRRRVAVPVRLDLRLGRLGRADPRRDERGAGTGAAPSLAAAALQGLCPNCGAKKRFKVTAGGKLLRRTRDEEPPAGEEVAEAEAELSPGHAASA